MTDKSLVHPNAVIFSRPYLVWSHLCYSVASVCLSVCRLSLCLSSVTLCIVAKRYVLQQKLLLRADTKSYMRNRFVPKWMTLTFI